MNEAAQEETSNIEENPEDIPQSDLPARPKPRSIDRSTAEQEELPPPTTNDIENRRRLTKNQIGLQRVPINHKRQTIARLQAKLRKRRRQRKIIDDGHKHALRAKLKAPKRSFEPTDESI